MQAESGETTNRECSVTRALGTREGDVRRRRGSGDDATYDARDLRRTRDALGGVRAVSGEPPKRKMGGRPKYTMEQRSPGVAVAFTASVRETFRFHVRFTYAPQRIPDD